MPSIVNSFCRIGIKLLRSFGMKGSVIWFCLLWFLHAHASAAPAERLFFLNNGEVLPCCIYKPEGKGPFPTVVFNQPVVKALPADGPVDPFPKLAKFFNSNGYALFVPGKHKVPGLKNGKPKEGALDDEKQEYHVEVVSSALAMLKAQSFVDAERIYVAGSSSGGTTTLLFAQKPLNVRGYVVFSPAVQIWKNDAITQDMLRKAVENAVGPVFLIQPQNDYSLGPMEVLGKELLKKGLPNRSKVFPPYGKDQTEGIYFATGAPEVWGPDVLSFFKEIAP